MKTVRFIYLILLCSFLVNCDNENEVGLWPETPFYDVYLFPYESTQTDKDGYTFETELPEEGGILYILSSKYANNGTMPIVSIEILDDDKYFSEITPTLEDYENLGEFYYNNYQLPHLYRLTTDYGVFTYSEYGKLECNIPELPEKVWKTRKIKIKIITPDPRPERCEITILQHNTQYNPYP